METSRKVNKHATLVGELKHASVMAALSVLKFSFHMFDFSTRLGMPQSQRCWLIPSLALETSLVHLLFSSNVCWAETLKHQNIAHYSSQSVRWLASYLTHLVDLVFSLWCPFGRWYSYTVVSPAGQTGPYVARLLWLWLEPSRPARHGR